MLNDAAGFIGDSTLGSVKLNIAPGNVPKISITLSALVGEQILEMLFQFLPYLMFPFVLLARVQVLIVRQFLFIGCFFPLLLSLMA